jgi:hypothetical protein
MSLTWTQEVGGVAIAICRADEPPHARTGVVYYMSLDASSGRQPNSSSGGGGGSGGRASTVGDLVSASEHAKRGMMQRLEAPAGSHFEPLPTPQKEKRDVLYVCGPAGAGKSHFCKMFVTNYRALRPSNATYLVSGLKKDKTLDSLEPPMQRVDVGRLADGDRTLVEDVETWGKCLLVVDDIESLDKREGDAVEHLEKTALCNGRHAEMSVLRCAHVGADYRRSKVMFVEMQGLVIFPSSRATSYDYLLSKKLNLPKSLVDKLLKLNDRWALIHHTNPSYVLTPRVCEIL